VFIVCLKEKRNEFYLIKRKKNLDHELNKIIIQKFLCLALIEWFIHSNKVAIYERFDLHKQLISIVSSNLQNDLCVYGFTFYKIEIGMKYLIDNLILIYVYLTCKNFAFKFCWIF